MQVFVCTPPPHPMDFHSQWPPSLPWLQFWPQLRSLLTRKLGFILKSRRHRLTQIPNHTAISNLRKRCHQIIDIRPMLRNPNVFLPLVSRTRDRISSAHLSLLELASMISMTMPEFDEDENIRRAGALMGHAGPDALFECLAIIIYHLSNNLYDWSDNERWETIVSIFRHFGLLVRPFITPAPHHITISAYLEKLFQAAVHQAVSKDNAEARDIIKWLLRLGQNPDAVVVSPGGWARTAVEACMDEGRVDLLQLLLDHGADANLASGRGKEKLRPLEYALEPKYRVSRFGDASWRRPLPPLVEIAHLLIFKGAKVNLPVCDGREPVLNLAIGLGDLDLVKLVIAHGADVQLGAEVRPNLLHTITPLSRAAGFRDKVSTSPVKRPGKALTLVRYITGLLRQRCPSSYKAEITADTFTAASAAGNYDVITFLADLSPPTNLTNPLGVTPLHGAAKHGCIQTCQVLLQLGCFFFFLSKYISPLHIACAFGHDEIVDIFIQNKAHLNARAELDRDSYHRHKLTDLDYSEKAIRSLCLRPRTPLEMAIYFWQNTSAVSLLLCQARVFGGELLLAVRQHPNIALLTALLDAGADPNERDGNGISVLRYLFRWVLIDDCDEEMECDPYEDVVTMIDLLLSHGAKIDCADLVGAFRLGIRSVSLALLRCESRSAEQAESKTQLLEEAMLSGDTAIIEMVSRLHQGLPYSPGAVCTAVIAKLQAERIKQLLAARSRHARANVYAATAIGIAAHQREDMTLLRLLCSCLPPSGTCFMPVRDRLGKGYLDLFGGGGGPRGGAGGAGGGGAPRAGPVRGHNKEAFNYLLEHGYKPDWTTWSAIAQENQAQMALALREERFTGGGPGGGGGGAAE